MMPGQLSVLSKEIRPLIKGYIGAKDPNKILFEQKTFAHLVFFSTPLVVSAFFLTGDELPYPKNIMGRKMPKIEGNNYPIEMLMSSVEILSVTPQLLQHFPLRRQNKSTVSTKQLDHGFLCWSTIVHIRKGASCGANSSNEISPLLSSSNSFFFIKQTI